MVAVVPADAADLAVRTLDDRDLPAWVAGTVHRGAADTVRVTLVGDYS
jgi:hypothetical protein